MAADSSHVRFSILPAFKLKGHQSAVLCCTTSGNRIVSGDEVIRDEGHQEGIRPGGSGWVDGCAADKAVGGVLPTKALSDSRTTTLP